MIKFNQVDPIRLTNTPPELTINEALKQFDYKSTGHLGMSDLSPCMSTHGFTSLDLSVYHDIKDKNFTDKLAVLNHKFAEYQEHRINLNDHLRNFIDIQLADLYNGSDALKALNSKIAPEVFEFSTVDSWKEMQELGCYYCNKTVSPENYLHQIFHTAMQFSWHIVDPAKVLAYNLMALCDALELAQEKVFDYLSNVMPYSSKYFSFTPAKPAEVIMFYTTKNFDKPKYSKPKMAKVVTKSVSVDDWKAALVAAQAPVIEGEL